MKHSNFTFVPTLASRAALSLLVLAGCVPTDGDAPSADQGAAGPSFDSGFPGDSGLDADSAHAAAVIPVALFDALEEDGLVTVIVEMNRVDMPQLARASGSERARMLGRRADAYRSAREALVRGLPSSARLMKSYRHLPLVTIEVTAEEALDMLARDRRTVALHADEVLEPVMGQSLDLINQPAAEEAGHTGSGTAVAILDTGLKYTHADFGSCTDVGTPASCRVVAMEDFAPEDNSLDDNGHGTNVSAIVGGVAPGTDLIGLDVFRGNGLAYTSEVVAAIDWVIDNQEAYNIVALNMSLGGGQYTSECAGSTYEVAIAAALEAGVASAVATGNNGWSNKIASPACSPSAVKVGAVYDGSYGRMRWSNCTDATTEADQVTCFSNANQYVDLLAPGALITAGGYTMGGTSMAAPHVAGALAVVAAAYPTEDPDDWTSRLIETGESITDARNSLVFPRIDVEAAVEESVACSFSLDAAGVSVPEAGGTGSFDLATRSTCEWSIVSDAGWLSLSPSSGTGDATVSWTATANAGDARTASATIDSASFQFSQAANAAPVGIVTIDEGSAHVASRSVTLSISASDANDSVAEMCIANVDGATPGSCSPWQSYSTARSWSLSSGQGEKQVGVWFRDSRGRFSSMATDAITLDTAAPSGSTLTSSATNGGALFSWTEASDAGVGLDSYSLRMKAGTSPPTTCSGGTLVYDGTDLTYMASGLTNDERYSFRLCAVDSLGNEGSLGSVTLRPSASAGGPGTLIINDGDAWTKSRSVKLTMSPGIDDPTHLCVSHSTECTSWKSVREVMGWTLPKESGAQTVYLKYRNGHGQESPVASGTISADYARPVDGVVTVTSGSRQADLSFDSFRDEQSGMSSYIAVMAEGLRAPSNCLSGTEVYSGSRASTTITGLTNGTNYSVRVCGFDAAGNRSKGVTGLLAPRGSSGPRGSITINGGDEWTGDRKVTVSVSSSSASEICLSNKNSCTKWQSIASEMAHTIGRNQGQATVYATFRNGSGDTSSVTADTIQYDEGRPRDTTLAVAKANRRLTLSWEDAVDGRSGVVSYIVVGTEDSVEAPRTCEDGDLLWQGTGTSTTVTGLSNNIPYGLRLCAVDEAGNVSRGATGVGWPGNDNTAPFGSFVVADDTEWVNNRNQVATFTVSDSGSGVRDVCVSRKATSCSDWVTYGSEVAARLGDKIGEQTMYAWVRDNQGNVSEVMEDTIGFDTKLPSGGVVVTGEGNGRVPVQWSDFEDKHSGIVSYVLVHDSKPMRSCGSGTVAYEGAGSSSTVTGLTNGTTYYFGVCAVDEAGNTGRVRRVQGRPASEYDAPTGSVTIADGAQYVGPGRTEVSITASDASGVTRMCVRASNSCTKWTDYATTATLSVGTKHREITGRVWLQDGQGNITSTPLSDTVFVDARRPSDGAVSASARSGGMRLVASGYADTDSGVAEYIVTGRTVGKKGPPACGGSNILHRGTGTTITLSGLSSGTEMKFRVCAVDAVGNISRGTVVTATPN